MRKLLWILAGIIALMIAAWDEPINWRTNAPAFQEEEIQPVEIELVNT